MPNYKHTGSVDKLSIGTTAGTAVGTDGTLVTAVSDVNIDYQREKIDVSDRASGAWGSNIPGSKDCELTFTYFDTQDATHRDAILERLLSAWHSGALVPMSACSVSGRGIDADWTIADVKDGQPVKDAATYEFTCSVCTDLRIPTELTATGTSS